jgi:hypothetical protein
VSDGADGAAIGAQPEETRSIGVWWCGGGGKGRYAKTGGAAVRDLVRSGTRIFILSKYTDISL